MDRLPAEMLNIIINYIEPNGTFDASRVCSKWKLILDNRYHTKIKKIVLFNDSYYMASIKDFTLGLCEKISQYIDNIISHNCLDVLAHNTINQNIHFTSKYIAQYFRIALIKQFCITNNANIIKYSSLIFMNEITPKIIINKMLKWCLLNNSYAITDFLLGFGPKINRWIMYLIKHNMLINNNIKKSLDYLIFNKAINMPEFYREMLLLKHKSQLCYDISKYIKNDIHDDVKKYIKQNLHNYTSFIIFYIY